MYVGHSTSDYGSSLILQLQGATKVGLMEKKSGGLKGGRKAYTFSLDYKEGTFKYTKIGVSIIILVVYSELDATPKLHVSEITGICEESYDSIG